MSGCVFGPRCVGLDRAAGQPAPAAPGAVCCQWCQRAASNDIHALPRDYVDLELAIGGGTAGIPARTSGRPDPAVPIALDVDALQREIVFTLTAWEVPVREAAGLAPERVAGVRPGRATAVAASVIGPRVDLMASLTASDGYWRGFEAGPIPQYGYEGISALRRLHGRVRLVLGRTRLTVSLPGDCSGCGLWSLRRDDGSDTVYCGGCGRRWTYSDYQRYVGLLLSGHV